MKHSPKMRAETTDWIAMGGVGMVFGVALALCGWPFWTWQFWVMMVVFVGVLITARHTARAALQEEHVEDREYYKYNERRRVAR